jgi:hypothetical protein
MNLLSKAKRVAAFAALTLTLTLPTASLPQGAGVFKFETGSASAAVRFQVIRVYFSDATFRTHVGTGVFRCDGSSSLTGRSTPYFRESKEPCCGNVVC